MIQKTKRPISILLVLLMIVGMFTVLPISAGAAVGDYYLVGWFNSWVVGDMNVKLVQNPDNPSEYMYLGMTFTEEDPNDNSFKVVSSDGNTWYPDDSAAYSIDAGTYDIYFRPDGKGGDQWFRGYIYAEPHYVAHIGDTKYATLADAIEAAQDGDTIALYDDITLPAQSISGESSQYGAYITKSLTIDGDGHTVTSAAPRVFGVKGTQGDIDVTFKNITVTDNEQGAVCVCTRGGINSLTLDNATLNTQGATSGYIQPLTIGGSQATQAKVNVVNHSTIQTGDAAGKHYAIILWNPVDLTIQDSTIKGWACVYQKPFSDASAGVKTEVTIDNSTLISKGIKGTSNNFATIFTENADFSCEITNTTMDITAAADTYQAVAASNNSASGFKVELGEGNNVTLTGDTAIIGYNFDDETHEIAVSGGTFNKPVADYYCAEDYLPVTNTDGTYTVGGPYVAKIGTTGYATLTEAIEAAQAGDTVTLLADITLPAQSISGESSTYGAYITKSLTIDGDGHTVTSAAPRVFGVKGTQGDIDVTFKNITVTDKAQGAVCVCTRGGIDTLTLDNATLSTQGATKGYIQPLTIGGSQATQAKVNVINGSTIQTGDAAGKHYAIILWNPVDLTIKDSTIKGWACVYQKPFENATAGVKTEVTIDNSTLISKGIKGTSNNFATIFTENADFSCEITNTTMDITAAADTYQAVAASNNSASGFKVELGEGNNVTLTGDTAIIGYNFDDETHEIAVSGGTFNKPVAEYYCAEGYIPATLDEETGKYSVKTGAYVAEINGTKYETLEEAFAAAVDGDTIKVLANCSGNGIQVLKNKFKTKGLTVDFDHHTYTMDGATVGSPGTKTQAFQLQYGNKITFKNGTLYSEKALFLVQNYSNLTLDGMTLTLDNPNYAYGYTLSNNNGNTVIKDTTINANPAGKFAFDVCRGGGSDAYPSVNVTVTGNSFINGDVEVDARNGDPKNGFSLNLESGNMTGKIKLTANAETAIDNNPDKASVNKQNTFTQNPAEGYEWKDNGDGTSTLVKIPDLFTGHSITLDGYINLNFYIDTDAIPGYTDATTSVKAKFTWDSQVTESGKHYDNDIVEVNLKGKTPDANGIVMVPVTVNAAQMANTINAVVEVNGTPLEETDKYSVMQYAEELLAGDYTDAQKTLVKEMLNYGAMAQKVFENQLSDKPNVYADSVLSSADRTAIANEMNDVDANKIIAAIKDANDDKRGATVAELRAIGEQIGGEWYTTSVIFLSGNTLRHYFDDVNDNKRWADADGVKDKYFYYVEKEDIPASKLDTLYEFTIGGESFQYSVLDYAAALLDSDTSADADVQNLAKALYLYNQAANACFPN